MTCGPRPTPLSQGDGCSLIPREGSPVIADTSPAGLIGETEVPALTAVVVVILQVNALVVAFRVPGLAVAGALLAGIADTRADISARAAVEIVALQVNAAEGAVGMPRLAARDDTLVGDGQLPVLRGNVHAHGTPRAS